MKNEDRTYSRDKRSPVPKDQTTSRIMSKVKAKNTKPELFLRKALWEMGIRGYRLHWKQVPGRPDVAFVKRKVAIFVNGCFWHRCPFCNLHEPKNNRVFWENKFNANVKRDKKKITLLKQQGWKVITIWECQIKENIKAQVKKIENLL